jgi:hypothetical protein
MYHKRLSWLKGKKEPLYSIQSGSKVALYTEVVQKNIYLGGIEVFSVVIRRVVNVTPIILLNVNGAFEFDSC